MWKKETMHDGAVNKPGDVQEDQDDGGQSDVG